MPTSVGDTLNFDGYSGTVVAVTATTDANGRGTVTYGGIAFSFRALKATVSGTDYPIVATADAVFRVAAVQQDSNPLLFCMVLDDGPAPWAGAAAFKARPDGRLRVSTRPAILSCSAWVGRPAQSRSRRAASRSRSVCRLGADLLDQ